MPRWACGMYIAWGRSACRECQKPGSLPTVVDLGWRADEFVAGVNGCQ
jgi:hypothetical protein